MNDKPVYAMPCEFFALLGLRPETGRRYVSRGILEPDAYITSSATNGERELFLTSPERLEMHRKAISEYRTWFATQRKRLAHV